MNPCVSRILIRWLLLQHLLLIVSGFIPVTFPHSYPPAPGGGGVLWVFGLLAAVQVTADSRFLSFV